MSWTNLSLQPFQVYHLLVMTKEGGVCAHCQRQLISKDNLVLFNIDEPCPALVDMRCASIEEVPLDS